MSKIAYLAVALGLVALTTPVRAANLITNGDFATNLTGWTTGGNGCAPVIAWSSTGNPGGSVLLNGCGEATSNPFASQTITGLTIGATYTIAWEIRQHVAAGGAGTGKSFGVFLDAQPSAPIAFAEFFMDNLWHNRQTTFVATSTSHTIIFAAELDARTPGGPGSTTDVSYYLDNVSVNLAGGIPSVVSLTPAASTGSNQVYTLVVSDTAGFQDLGILNFLMNTGLDGVQACYLAYSVPAGLLFLVSDNGSGLSPGLALNGSGSISNSQCSVSSAGSSAVGSGNGLTLTLNMSFTPAFAGNKVIYVAARSAAEANSGWQLLGVHNIPGAPVTFPRSLSVTPSSGNASNAVITFAFQDASSFTNLQTSWALVNTGIDAVGACYVAYYRPGNLIFLYPDNGDGSQATSTTLAGTNSLSNSQCTVSSQGSSVTANGNELYVSLNITFKPAFAGAKGIWTATSTLAGQSSNWQALGVWRVP